jgi:hypothetical protein
MSSSAIARASSARIDSSAFSTRWPSSRLRAGTATRDPSRMCSWTAWAGAVTSSTDSASPTAHTRSVGPRASTRQPGKRYVPALYGRTSSARSSDIAWTTP